MNVISKIGMLGVLSALLCLASTGSSLASPDVHAAGVDPLTATPVQREQAQSRFLRGKDLFDQGQFEAAIDEFDASRAIVASPNAKLYRARSLLRLDRWVEAYNELGSTVVEAVELSKFESRYARTAEAASLEREELQKQLAFIRLNVLRPHPETEVRVNGEQLRRTAWAEAIPAKAGIAIVRVTSPDRPVQEKELSLAAGDTVDVVFDVAPVVRKAEARPVAPLPLYSDQRASYRPYAYAAAGVGAVGVGAFTVLGLMSNNTYDHLNGACPNGDCPGAEESRIATGKSQQRWANIGLAVGVLGIGGAVTLFVLDGGDGEQQNRLSVGVTLDRIVVSGKL